ncbi:MAG TPA: hypothetical protein VJ865_05460 [Gemmatimonadaceae bacterium]|nr:hypothetical protein [Gemmatimonadaceae bacterium]
MPVVARAACDTMAKMLRGAAVAAGDKSSAVAFPADTTGFLRDKTEAACVVYWRDSTAHVLPLSDVYALLERSGWQRRERLLYASGPGTEAVAFSRGGAACVVSGEGDVDDDDDSTRVPVPGFIISGTCFPDRPDPPPVVERLVSSPQVPVYMSSASPLGAGCGADRAGISDALVSVVDVFIDSVADDGLGELPVVVSLAPKSGAGQASSISAKIVYPVEGRPAASESFSDCTWSKGIRLRLNASRLSRAALTLDATGPVRVAVRSMSGALLATPMLVEPGTGPHTIRWLSRR